jgi:hypothetical protein
MNIKWNKYTWYSKLAAIIFFIAILPAWTFYIGIQYEKTKVDITYLNNQSVIYSEHHNIAKISQSNLIWNASSKTSGSITGNITLSPEKIIFNDPFQTDPAFPHSQKVEQLQLKFSKFISSVGVNELGFGTLNNSSNLELYKIIDPHMITVLRENTLCGAQPATYLVLGYNQSRTEMTMAMFSGEQEPIWKDSYLNQTKDLCGTFSYYR